MPDGKRNPRISRKASPTVDPRHVLGRKAESLVADYLVARGFTILAENLRVGHLEVDVLARWGSVVALVEVRTRSAGSFLPALSTFSKAKRERLMRAADQLWQTRFANDKDIERIRIDVAVVFFEDGPPRVEYLEGAVSRVG